MFSKKELNLKRGRSIFKNKKKINSKGSGGEGFILKNQFEGEGRIKCSIIRPTSASQIKLKIFPKGLPFVILFYTHINPKIKNI